MMRTKQCWGVAAQVWWTVRDATDAWLTAKVVEAGQSQCVPFKCCEDVLVIREGKVAAPDNEVKYYTPGVGRIRNTPRSASQHRDMEKLINLTQLSRRGPAELSTEALTLDKRAKDVAPDVFGDVPTGKQSL
jgi:hypothetical protein